MTAHAFEQQTGEVRIKIDGETLEDLFVEATRALADLVGTPSEDPAGPWQHVTVEAQDRDGLLVVWLNELIERTEIDRLLYSEVELDSVTPTELRARIRGVPIAELATSVKVATTHGLRIGAGPDGMTVTVVLEIRS